MVAASPCSTVAETHLDQAGIFNSFGQPTGQLAMFNGRAVGKMAFKILKTYAPGPWLDVAVRAQNPDGSISGGCANQCRVALPPGFPGGPSASHIVRILQNGSVLADGEVTTLAGLVLEIDGTPRWSQPVSPFGGMTGQFG